VTTFKLSGGKTATLKTTLHADKPVMRLDVSGMSGELTLALAGADRLTFASGGGFAARKLAATEHTIALPPAAAFQNRRSQDGIVIHADSRSGTPLRMRAVCGPDGVAVRMICPPGGDVSVMLAAFRGDASIACEDVAPRITLAKADDAPSVPDDPQSEQVADQTPQGRPQTGWSFFSNRPRALAPLLADQREAQIRAGWMYGRGGNKLLDLGFGGDLGIVRKDISETEAMTLTLRGLFTARFNTHDRSFPLLNTDYYGGFAFGHKFDNDAWELYVFHQSAHLGDETLDFGHRERIDYGREAVRFLWSHHFDDLRIYGGPTVNVSGSRHYIRGRATLQAGAEYRFRPWEIPMYAAADVQAKQENEWRPNLTTQVGMELGDPEEPDPKTRLFLELYTGYSNMGQYWNEYETSVMLGIGHNW